MDLETIDSRLRSIARRYASTPNDIDDAEQMARIAVWTILEKNPDAPIPYLLKAAEYAIANENKRNRAQKRKPKGGIVSLSEPDPNTELTLEDRIGIEDIPTLEQEALENFHIALRSRGSRYVQRILEQHKPKEKVREIIRYVVEEVCAIPKNRIVGTVDYEFFREKGLDRLLWVFYRNSPWAAIADAYPGEFKPWHGKRVPKGFWHGKKGYDHAVEAVRWLVSKKGVTSEADCWKITSVDFEKERLIPMLHKFFNDSPHLALKVVFPELKPWQSHMVPQGYLDNLENRKSALESYIMDHCGAPLAGLDAEQTYEAGLRTFVSNESLQKYGLTGLLARYEKSTYLLFHGLFPQQIYPWTIPSTKEPWRINPRAVAADAVRWLFDRYLEIPVHQLPLYASNKLFWKVGFSGILTNRNIGFNSSTFAAVDNAYPGVFSYEDFSRNRRTISVETKEMRKESMRKK